MGEKKNHFVSTHYYTWNNSTLNASNVFRSYKNHFYRRYYYAFSLLYYITIPIGTFFFFFNEKRISRIFNITLFINFFSYNDFQKQYCFFA